eukprot:7209549-Lingulodinium_polyedra.AAC.1
MPGGRPGPKPLRSAAQPRGLDNLALEGAAKVATASALYEFVAEQLIPAIPGHAAWSVENPVN